MTTLSINSCHTCYYDAFLYACQITCYRDTFVVVVARVLPRYLCYFATPSVTFATPFYFILFFTLPHCPLPRHIVYYPATSSVTLPQYPLPCNTPHGRIILIYLATFSAASPRHLLHCHILLHHPHQLLLFHIICYVAASSATLKHHLLPRHTICYLSADQPKSEFVLGF